jgi:hypothetical protein
MLSDSDERSANDSSTASPDSGSNGVNWLWKIPRELRDIFYEYALSEVGSDSTLSLLLYRLYLAHWQSTI